MLQWLGLFLLVFSWHQQPQNFTTQFEDVNVNGNPKCMAVVK